MKVLVKAFIQALMPMNLSNLTFTFVMKHLLGDELIIDVIRFARIEDIAAMKLGVIANGGRKKDYWDIHELLETTGLKTMIGWWQEMYPYADKQDIINGMTDFSFADDEVDP